MKLYFICFVIGFSVILGYETCHCSSVYQPEQIHLSYGVDPTKMMVVWNTFQPTPNPVVEFGESSRSRSVSASVTKFVDGGPAHHTQYIYRATLTGLVPGRSYFYQCGSKLGLSSVFSFTAMRNGTNWSPRFLLFGDLGVVNGRSLPRLIEEAEKNSFDAVLHVGDFAYDMDKNDSLIGDQFMRNIQPLATKLPYMTCPGNHEWAYNFSNYRNRFSMPTDEYGQKMFFSFNIGPAHIVSFSTEAYFAVEDGLKTMFDQYNWLMRDLEEASRPENRTERPWIITMGHRPMYCSNSDKDDCTKRESIVRTGVPFLHILGLEKLFNSYGVDLMLWAHEHSYERLWPIFDRKVYNGTESPYVNPPAPVHIITGSAGCDENLDPFLQKPANWSAVRIDDYGYGRMTIQNKTHLHFEQVSDEQNGKVVDSLWLQRDHHGPFVAKNWRVVSPH